MKKKKKMPTEKNKAQFYLRKQKANINPLIDTNTITKFIRIPTLKSS